ncbi:MAG: pyruvate dehydrogenase E1 component subunit beta [archaeon GW2011_AR19]|nr:MAG: pyruvate dehydrogenase E1 component subunit beta [archaeon GW2011_AR19]
MKYKDAIKKSMEELAKLDKVRFLGYNVNRGSRAYGTLKDVPKEKCIETPVAENLMVGLAIGMSLEGYKPVVFFERHDFILNSLDAIVNHLDKIEKMSYEQFKTPVIIRANVGAKKPLTPGAQHTQDFTEILKKIVTFPVYELLNSKQVIECYSKVKNFENSALIIERRELYDCE